MIDALFEIAKKRGQAGSIFCFPSPSLEGEG